MPSVVCPRCSCRQAAGAECRICHAKLPAEEEAQKSAAPASASVGDETPAPQKAPPGLLRKIWRVSNWLTMAALVWVVVMIMRPARAPVIHADPQAAVRAETKVRESQEAASAGQPTPLRFDEAELNAFLASNLGLASSGAAGATTGEPSPGGGEPSVEEVRSTVKDVKVTMQDDRVQAYVLFDFHGKDLTLVLEGRLGAKDGYLHFEPTRGKLGSLPIPQSTLESAVARMFDSPENRDKLKLPDGVGDIRIENGELVVTPR
jgi:hypothetical protein